MDTRNSTELVLKSLTSMSRLAVADEMSTAFWKQSLAADVLPARRCAAARSRCSFRALAVKGRRCEDAAECPTCAGR